MLLCILLLGVLPLQAAPVSKGRALEVAKAVLAAQPATKAGGAVNYLWDGEDIPTKAGESPAFYVFGRDGGGFVIVAGDDNVRPVLALSDRNEFRVEDMPENVRWWMDRMKAWVREQTEPAPEARALWARFSATKAGPLPGPVDVKVDKRTPEWGQHPPYNAKCPLDGENNLTLTGCEATALGEILTTMSGIYSSTMPAKATGTIEPYTAKTGYVSASTEEHPYVLGTTYQWSGLRSLMTHDAVLNASGELRENLAQLLADLGAMVMANYSATGTGAQASQAKYGLAAHMGFNKAAVMVFADLYTRAEWEDLLMAQLDRHPLFYSGKRFPGGHAFVFDGYGEYEGATVFHVNFGWNGSYNGYYYQTLLEPREDRYYKYECAAIFDLYPDPESTWPRILTMDGKGLQYVYDGSLVASFGEGGRAFSLDGSLWNDGDETYDGNLKLVLLDKDGNPKEEVLLIEDLHWDVGKGYEDCSWSGLTFNEPLSFGDAIAFYFTTDDARKEWAPVGIFGLRSTVISRLPVFPAAFIQTAGSYAVGDTFYFVLMNHDIRYLGTTWQITGPDGSTVSLEQSQGGIKLTKSGRYKIEAAVAPTVGDPVTETLVTYITVN